MLRLLICLFSMLAMNGTCGAENSRDRSSKYIGAHTPPAPSECKLALDHFNSAEFREGEAVLFVDGYTCSGILQFWLLRRIDESGNTVNNNTIANLNEERRYIVEDIYVAPQFKHNQNVIKDCKRNGIEPGDDFPFAFAIGTTTPLYDSYKTEIGYSAKSITVAWKVNVRAKKFERISTKGIFCEFWE